ncbi:MAG: hypothetical protein ACXWQ5_18315 [Ktedonobacterales bacterium]
MAVLTQADYEQLHHDLIVGTRGGHPLAKDEPFHLSIIRDVATCEDSQTYLLHYADGSPDERLVFHNADGVRFHAIGAGPV